MQHSLLSKLIGDYLLQQRRTKGINQNDLAKKLKISPQFLGRIEKGDVMMPERLLVKSYKFLDLKFNEIEKIYKRSCASELHNLQVKLVKSKN